MKGVRTRGTAVSGGQVGGAPTSASKQVVYNKVVVLARWVAAARSPRSRQAFKRALVLTYHSKNND